MSLYDDEDYIKLPEEPKEEPKAQSSSAQPKDEGRILLVLFLKSNF